MTNSFDMATIANRYIHALTHQQRQLLLLLSQLKQKKLRLKIDYQTSLSRLNSNEETIELAFKATNSHKVLSHSLFTNKVTTGLALKKQIAQRRSCLCKTEQNIAKFKQQIQSTQAVIALILSANHGGSKTICVHLELKAHQVHTSNTVLIALHQRILFAE